MSAVQVKLSSLFIWLVEVDPVMVSFPILIWVFKSEKGLCKTGLVKWINLTECRMTGWINLHNVMKNYTKLRSPNQHRDFSSSCHAWKAQLSWRWPLRLHGRALFYQLVDTIISWIPIHECFLHVGCMALNWKTWNKGTSGWLASHGYQPTSW